MLLTNLLPALADVSTASLYASHTLQYVMKSLSASSKTLCLALATAASLINDAKGDLDDSRQW